jgi:hypothetical protein
MTAQSPLQEFEQWLGQPLAAPLASFLGTYGGAPAGECGVIYSAEELLERNECYETKGYCPGWVTIGDNGGGRAVVVAPSLVPSTVFVVGHGVMAPEYFRVVAKDLSEWVRNGFPDEPAQIA